MAKSASASRGVSTGGGLDEGCARREEGLEILHALLQADRQLGDGDVERHLVS